jgi:hypothetical protein
VPHPHLLSPAATLILRRTTPRNRLTHPRQTPRHQDEAKRIKLAIRLVDLPRLLVNVHEINPRDEVVGHVGPDVETPAEGEAVAAVVGGDDAEGAGGGRALRVVAGYDLSEGGEDGVVDLVVSLSTVFIVLRIRLRRRLAPEADSADSTLRREEENLRCARSSLVSSCSCSRCRG